MSFLLNLPILTNPFLSKAACYIYHIRRPDSCELFTRQILKIINPFMAKEGCCKNRIMVYPCEMVFNKKIISLIETTYVNDGLTLFHTSNQRSHSFNLKKIVITKWWTSIMKKSLMFPSLLKNSIKDE